MELNSMILPEKVATFEFPGCEGLEFDLVFLSKDSSQKLLKKCQKTVIDPRTRTKRDELDEDLFMKVYVESIVKDWRGFKLKYLEELVPIDIEEDQRDLELEYSPSNAIDLMKNSAVFDNWVSEVISDLANFTKKNSKKK